MPRKTTAYLCEHKCGHCAVVSKKRMTEHEGRCAMNPIRKSCKTCKHNVRDPDDGIYCGIDAIPEGIKLMYDCPQWESPKAEIRGGVAVPLDRKVRAHFTTEIDMERGEGATTQQMEAAPKGAIFVWCNGRTDYPILLARKIGREDLQIKSPAWLTSHVWRGVSLAGIVVDHAARLTGRELEELYYALACVRPNVELTRLP